VVDALEDNTENQVVIAAIKKLDVIKLDLMIIMAVEVLVELNI